jgi:hypothetical protein
MSRKEIRQAQDIEDVDEYAANPYHLLGRKGYEENEKFDPNITLATREITKVLQNTARKIQAIGREFTAVGIGDTDTDEAISDAFFAGFHFDNWPDN